MRLAKAASATSRPAHTVNPTGRAWMPISMSTLKVRAKGMEQSRSMRRIISMTAAGTSATIGGGSYVDTEADVGGVGDVWAVAPREPFADLSGVAGKARVKDMTRAIFPRVDDGRRVQPHAGRARRAAAIALAPPARAFAIKKARFVLVRIVIVGREQRVDNGAFDVSPSPRPWTRMPRMHASRSRQLSTADAPLSRARGAYIHDIGSCSIPSRWKRVAVSVATCATRPIARRVVTTSSSPAASSSNGSGNSAPTRLMVSVSPARSPSLSLARTSARSATIASIVSLHHRR